MHLPKVALVPLHFHEYIQIAALETNIYTNFYPNFINKLNWINAKQL